MAMLDRLEAYGDSQIEGKYLQLSFDTKYRGIWQCRWSEDGGMSQYAAEPPFESLTKEEQKQVRQECQIIFLFTFGDTFK